METLQKLVKLLEKHPVAWFVAGMLMVLLAEGSFKVEYGSNAIAILTPKSMSVRMICRFLGVTFAIAAFFIYLHQFPVQNSQTPLVKKLAPFLCLLWLVSMVILTFQWYQAGNLSIGPEYWRYNLVSHQYEIQVNRESLKKHIGERLLFVVRVSDKSIDPETDKSVIFSNTFLVQPVPEEQYYIPLNGMKQTLDLGIWLECYAFIMPTDDSANGAKCIADLRSNQGIEFFDQPVSSQVAVDSKDLAQFWAGVSRLSRENQEELKLKLMSLK